MMPGCHPLAAFCFQVWSIVLTTFIARPRLGALFIAVQFMLSARSSLTSKVQNFSHDWCPLLLGRRIPTFLANRSQILTNLSEQPA
jgi:hypothetical protein